MPEQKQCCGTCAFLTRDTVVYPNGCIVTCALVCGFSPVPEMFKSQGAIWLPDETGTDCPCYAKQEQADE